jgi:hypothetical protein
MATYNEAIAESVTSAYATTQKLMLELTSSGDSTQALDLEHFGLPSESVVATDTLIGLQVTGAASTGNATSTLEGDNITVVASTANATATLEAGVETVEDLLASSALAESSVRLVIIPNATSAAVAAATLEVEHYANVFETANATSADLAENAAPGEVSSTAAATDELELLVTSSLTSTANGTSAHVPVITAVSSSTGAATSTDLAVTTRIEDLESDAVAAATTLLRADIVAVVSSDGEVRSYVRLPADAVPALWSNARTTAAAQWTALELNSLVEADGVVYGAGVDGVHQLSNTGDHEAEVMWDAQDFGTAQLKTVEALYIDGATESPFTVTVTGTQGTYEYETHLTGYSDRQNHRALLGRGFKSPFYTFSISSDVHFEAGRVMLHVAEAARRRG